MKKVNLLSKAEMKKVIGGMEDLCKGMTGTDLAICRLNVCLDGWNNSEHTEKENENKYDGCCALSGAC